MAQINLLKQTNSHSDWIPTAMSIAVKLLMVVVLAVVGYYVWLYFQNKNEEKAVATATTEVSQAQAKLASVKNKDEIFTRLGQLKEQDGLVTNHIYWSEILPELGKATLKNANYNNIKFLADGTATMQVIAPDLKDLDKYLQVFDLPEYNKYFSDVRIGAINKSQQGDGQGFVKVDVKMKFDPSMLRYNFKSSVPSPQ